MTIEANRAKATTGDGAIPTHPAVRAFAEGIDGACPAPSVIDAAARIAVASLQETVEPEITVDVDGALSFDLRLANGFLLLAELDTDGGIDASIYDDHQGALIERLPHTTASELIKRF